MLGKAWRIVVLLAAGWAVVAGCSSFSGDDAPAEPPIAEAGADATVLADAEAGTAADASPRFCKTGDASTALFCADFDEGAVTTGWQLPFTLGGTLELTPSDRSPPNAALGTVDTLPLADAGAGGTDGDGGDPTPYGAAVLTTTFGRGGATGASLEFDIRIDELPTAADGGVAGGELATVGFNIDNQSVGFAFLLGQSYLVVRDPGIKSGGDYIQASAPLPTGWFHVEIRTAFTGAGASLSFNGIQVASAGTSLLSENLGIFLNVGPTATGTSGKARVAYDNVTLRLL